MATIPPLPGHLPDSMLRITGPLHPGYEHVLDEKTLRFLVALQRSFNHRRRILLMERQQTQQRINHGWKPNYDPETRAIRESAWQTDPVPEDLQDRRVEITGPVDRKMIINALNAGAKVFMADFEDSNAPNWKNVVEGQINLSDAIDGSISFRSPDNGKEYTLNSTTATLMVRPRGWHLEEKHILIDGEPASASLVDFGIFFFRNARKLISKGTGPYFYLPKLEHYKEARLWNDVFVFAQDYCGIPQGTIKATVLVETILASFQLHEILFELRHHSAGMNCGRWDYIFSFIKKFRDLPGFVFPDRAQVTMTVPCMRAYTQLVIRTCHERGAHAIGGMAAQIPVKDDPVANKAAMEKVKADKLREVKDGHDGTWVAHPGLVTTAMEVFDEYMPGKNQIIRKRDDFNCTEAELLELPKGTITEAGIRANINVGILYLESWLRGNGAAAIHHLMEDAATAEISRTQVWQWLNNQVQLEDGRTFNHSLYEELRDDEIENIQSGVGSEAYQKGKFVEAICIFNRLVVQPEFEEFLTIPAYNSILSNAEKKQCTEETISSNPLPMPVQEERIA
ncbi:MAG: malate synthase A [Chitinophagaceae bacterium]|nr:malate synthase A [Chitinophagaceae bacterium]